jgi:hypothetical protein
MAAPAGAVDEAQGAAQNLFQVRFEYSNPDQTVTYPSEQLYYYGYADRVDNDARALARLRAPLLGLGAVLVGVRVQESENPNWILPRTSHIVPNGSSNPKFPGAPFRLNGSLPTLPGTNATITANALRMLWSADDGAVDALLSTGFKLPGANGTTYKTERLRCLPKFLASNLAVDDPGLNSDPYQTLYSVWYALYTSWAAAVQQTGGPWRIRVRATNAPYDKRAILQYGTGSAPGAGTSVLLGAPGVAGGSNAAANIGPNDLVQVTGAGGSKCSEQTPDGFYRVASGSPYDGTIGGTQWVDLACSRQCTDECKLGFLRKVGYTSIGITSLAIKAYSHHRVGTRPIGGSRGTARRKKCCTCASR